MHLGTTDGQEELRLPEPELPEPVLPELPLPVLPLLPELVLPEELPVLPELPEPEPVLPEPLPLEPVLPELPLPVGTEPVGTAGAEVGELPGTTPPVGEGVSPSVTGQTVVEMAMVEVTTDTELAGQLVTVGAQLVMVTSFVV